MPVVSIGDYAFEAADREAVFHGNRLLYIGWDGHLLFCAPHCFPFPPSMPLRDVVDKVLPGVYGYHPDFARIDWGQVQWLRGGQPWQPDFDRTLEQNGLGHKDVIRFRTPGLDGIGGSRS
ncbi:Phenol hydroxylase P4 protein [Cupriavidus taiwanensis]|uniref:Phenol hydroxylase P4 protein n=1 Tax=Cupriavidus taiwanensis TaxID=164546 RepID=A0A976A3X4_9BURK|nr:phenol hydroxylase subunit P4 [Cupriavidus taiwanensis]SOY60035.1 Phenol hydroxylase P4 protein [Cupriavidus taiwanensis]SPA02923.1 Phenol hydroxylase P4 protein [Cupriavidus taiwanensis]